MEFLSFIKSQCAHLLHPVHQSFLSEFENSPKQEQALLVRCINRKQPAIKSASLIFKELQNIDGLVETLLRKGWLRKPSEKDSGLLLRCLTKDELFQLCQVAESGDIVRKSLPKAPLLEIAKTLSARQIETSTVAAQYIVRNCDHVIDYFLYLYFGNCRDKLNKFSMRDLGVMKTREENAQIQARFSCKLEALSCFNLTYALSHFRYLELVDKTSIERAWSNIPSANGDAAIAMKNKLCFRLALKMLEIDAFTGVQMLSDIEMPEAQEKWCREAYKLGFKEKVEIRLHQIIDQPLSDHLAYFAEDFLARKYHQKRTSLMTDMLRDTRQHIVVDEIYKGSVENGVIAHYRNVQWNDDDNNQVHFSENGVWRALFILTFYQEIFETKGLGLSTEFDYVPECLKQNTLYTSIPDVIEHKLASIKSQKQWIVLMLESLCKASAHTSLLYGNPVYLIEKIKVLLTYADVDGLKAIVLLMAKDWKNTKDGFPDLLIVEKGKLRFEEIKAEGDVLRRNQLLRLQQLRQVGFDVRITTVEFAIDPMQPYVVVDIETTGGRASHHRITEIGMVKMINGEIIDEWQSLLNPERNIPRNITSLTGITNEMVENAPLFSEVAEQVDTFTDNAIFVAHNVNFDYGFIREEFARIGQHWRRPKLCTVQQMRQHYKGLPSYSLANLTKHFDIDMQRHHRAMSDALAATELLKLVNFKRVNTTSAIES